MKLINRESIRGFVGGFCLGILAENLSDLFIDGLFSILFAGPGEPGFEGIQGILLHRLVSQPLLIVSIFSLIITGIFIGVKLHRFQVSVVRFSPALFIIGPFIAFIWSLFLVRSSGFCGTERLFVQKQIFSILTIMAIGIMLVFIVLAQYILNKYPFQKLA